MDTQNLKAFVSVAASGSFSAAAEALHLTQPAISKRIHNLEDQLGARLLDRIGRRMVLTEAGQCLLPNAHRILQMMDEARQALDDLAGPVRGTLRLATSHHIGLHRLPEVLKTYRQAHHQAKLNIQFLNSRESHEAILAGTAELGITTEEALSPDQIVSRVVWQDRLHFVVAHSHPLANKKALSLADLSQYPALLPDARFTTGRIIRELFQSRHCELTVDEDLSTDYLETLKALIGIGDGWGVLPQTMVDDAALKVLEPEGVALIRNLVCIRHRDRTLSRAAKAFDELLGSA